MNFEELLEKGASSLRHGKQIHWVMIASALLSAIIITIIISSFQFHIGHNDFWGILYYSQTMKWSDKGSLYNGFFPIGYPLLLKVFPVKTVAIYAHVINIILSSALVTAITTLAAYKKGILGAVVAFVLAMTCPLFLSQGAIVAGPYIGASAITALAIWLLWKGVITGQEEPLSQSHAVLCGVLLGLATLWRSHCVVSSLAIIFTFYFVQGVKPLRVKGRLLVSFLLVASIQVVVNLLSDHGPFETAQKLNLYKLLHKVDWAGVPFVEKSALDLVTENWDRLVGIYLANIVKLNSLALPAIVCWLISKDKGVMRYSLFCMVAIFLYSIPLAFSNSERTSVVLLSLYIPPLAILCVDVIRRIHGLFRASGKRYLALFALFGCLGFALLRPWYLKNALLIEYYALRQGKLQEIEKLLLQNGLKTPREVFANSFNLYLPDVPPYQPRVNGGWMRYGSYTYKYNEEFPNLPWQSSQEFAEACAKNGIRFLVIDRQSARIAPAFSDLYKYRKHDFGDVMKVDFLGTIWGYKIFSLDYS